jgi:putative chitinase
MKENLNDTRLSPHFLLSEFLNVGKYPDNKPTLQDVANMTYGCIMLLEPARLEVGPIIINSGFRNSYYK